MFRFGRSNDALWEELQRMRLDLSELKADHADLAGKYERLRGAFYQARDGLAVDGTPITPKRRANGESRDDFKARKLAALRGAPLEQE